MALGSFGDMVDEIITVIRGYTTDKEKQGELVGNMGANDLTFAVKDGRTLTPGLCEIDDEIMWVSSVDSSGNATVAAYGRGFMGSTATTHTAGVRVTDNPVFERFRVKQSINDVCSAIYPDVYATHATTLTAVLPQVSYDLASNIEIISSVAWQTIGPSQMWAKIKHYRLDPDADTTAFPSGKALEIMEPMIPGRSVRVVGYGPPVALSASSDAFTATGFDAGVRDVVVFGVLARLLPGLEAARLQPNSVEASQRSEFVPVGASMSLSKYYQQMFTSRLNDERERLQKIRPLTVHYTYF